ncbi:MAG: hypothetical protein QG576_712, partial [Bacteroidota bacterium]|nr:hypothetical protein [Bacteroidota bacterium]
FLTAEYENDKIKYLFPPLKRVKGMFFTPPEPPLRGEIQHTILS